MTRPAHVTRTESAHSPSSPPTRGAGKSPFGARDRGPKPVGSASPRGDRVATADTAALEAGARLRPSSRRGPVCVRTPLGAALEPTVPWVLLAEAVWNGPRGRGTPSDRRRVTTERRELPFPRRSPRLLHAERTFQPRSDRHRAARPPLPKPSERERNAPAAVPTAVGSGVRRHACRSDASGPTPPSENASSTARRPFSLSSRAATPPAVGMRSPGRISLSDAFGSPDRIRPLPFGSVRAYDRAALHDPSSSILARASVAWSSFPCSLKASSRPTAASDVLGFSPERPRSSHQRRAASGQSPACVAR